MTKEIANVSLESMMVHAPWGTLDKRDWARANGPLCVDCYLKWCCAGKELTGEAKKEMDEVCRLLGQGEPHLRNSKTAKLYRLCFPKGFSKK